MEYCFPLQVFVVDVDNCKQYNCFINRAAGSSVGVCPMDIFLGENDNNDSNNNNETDQENENYKENENDKEDDEGDDYVPTTSRTRYPRKSKPLKRQVLKPAKNNNSNAEEEEEWPLSRSAAKIVAEFEMGPLPCEPVSDHHRRIVQKTNDLIVDHIRSIGSKICSKAKSQTHSGDFLARMKGCLRNAAMGLYLVEHLPETASLNAQLLRSIMACVPPQSKRPAAKRVDAMLSKVRAAIGIAPADRKAVDQYWTSRLEPRDLQYMRDNSKNWPGHWNKVL